MIRDVLTAAAMVLGVAGWGMVLLLVEL